MKKDELLESGYEKIDGDKVDTLYKKFDTENRGVFIFQYKKNDDFIGGIYLSEDEFNQLVSGPWTKPNI